MTLNGKLWVAQTVVSLTLLLTICYAEFSLFKNRLGTVRNDSVDGLRQPWSSRNDIRGRFE